MKKAQRWMAFGHTDSELSWCHKKIIYFQEIPRDVAPVNSSVNLVNVSTKDGNATEGQIVGTNQMKEIAVSW